MRADEIIRQVLALMAEYPELHDDPDLRADMIEAETSATEYLGKLVERWQESVTLADALGVRINLMRDRKAMLTRRSEAMKKLMVSIMQAADLKKVALPEATLSVRAGTPKTEIMSEADIPDYFWKVERTLKLKEIGEALRAGQTVLGACLRNGPPSLTVRVV